MSETLSITLNTDVWTLLGQMEGYWKLKELKLSVCESFSRQDAFQLATKSLVAVQILTLRLTEKRSQNIPYGAIQELIHSLKPKGLQKLVLDGFGIDEGLNGFLSNSNLPVELHLVVAPLRAKWNKPDEEDDRRALMKGASLFIALGKSNIERLKLKFNFHCYHEEIPLPDSVFAPVLNNHNLTHLEVDGGDTFGFENFKEASCEALRKNNSLKEIEWDGSIEHDPVQLKGILSAIREESNVLSRFEVYRPNTFRKRKAVTESMKRDYGAIRLQLKVNGDRNKHWRKGQPIGMTEMVKWLLILEIESPPTARYWQTVPNTWKLSRTYEFLRSSPSNWSNLDGSSKKTSGKKCRKRKRGVHE